MHSAILKNTQKLLDNKYFQVCVDLGCGEGYYGPTLKKHCNLLIGVDHNRPRLAVAKEFSDYNQTIYSQIQEYTPPPTTELLVMFEVIEHLPKNEGQQLLEHIKNVPHVMITTPKEFHKVSLRNGHVSLWTEEDFQKLNYKTTTFTYDLGWLPIYAKTGIYATKGF